MSRERTKSLISTVQARASALVSAPEIPSLVIHLENLPAIVAELTSSLRDPGLREPDLAQIHNSARESLLHLQHALIYVQSRLQHEHGSLLQQLRELAMQQEWAERSRQIT